MLKIGTIIDGMRLVQKERGEDTFQDFSKQLFSTVLNVAGKSNCVDIVCDVYLKMSIKNLERQIV